MTKEELMDLWIAMCNSKKTKRGGSYGSGPFIRKIELPDVTCISVSDYGEVKKIYGPESDPNACYELSAEEYEQLRQPWENKRNGAGYTMEEIKALL